MLLLLQYDSKYYYEVGIGNTTRQFWFITPPKVGPDVPYTFGLIGSTKCFIFSHYIPLNSHILKIPIFFLEVLGNRMK